MKTEILNTARKQAEKIISAHTARHEAGKFESKAIYEGYNLVGYEKINHPEWIDSLEFTGNIKCDGIKRELVPNLTNCALMDVAEVTSYSAEFIHIEKHHGMKKTRKTLVWYYVTSEINRIEIGSYYDKR